MTDEKSGLTCEKLLNAIELMKNPPPEDPVYIAPSWVFNDHEKLAAFKKVCQGFHNEEVTVIEEKMICPDSWVETEVLK